MYIVIGIAILFVFVVGLLFGLSIGTFPTERKANVFERILEKAAATLEVGQETGIHITICKDDSDDDDGGEIMDDTKPLESFRWN